MIIRFFCNIQKVINRTVSNIKIQGLSMANSLKFKGPARHSLRTQIKVNDCYNTEIFLFIMRTSRTQSIYKEPQFQHKIYKIRTLSKDLCLFVCIFKNFQRPQFQFLLALCTCKRTRRNDDRE